MRIAMFTNNYKPNVGGVPISVEHLAAALRALGQTVYVFAPSYDNQVEEAYVIRYPAFPLKIAGIPIPNVLTKIIMEKVIELQIDLIHVHHPALVGNVALSIRRKLGIPVVFTYHTRYEEYLHYVKPLRDIDKYTGMVEWYLRHFCGHCDMIVAPTPGIRDHLLLDKNIDTPIGVMPTGIPQESFEPDQNRVSTLRKIYKREADYLFCTVSRLAEEKNLIFQLYGIKQLKENFRCIGRTFRHLMIGDGPQRKVLSEKILELGLQNEVLLIGNVDNSDIKNYQAASDLFLFTSKSETQGIVLLEAMAVGNPVIAVQASGVKDMIENTKNGYLATEDVFTWAGAIQKALSDPEVYRTMCEHAKETAEMYSEEAIAKQAQLYYLNTCRRCKKLAQSSTLFQQNMVN